MSFPTQAGSGAAGAPGTAPARTTSGTLYDCSGRAERLALA